MPEGWPVGTRRNMTHLGKAGSNSERRNDYPGQKETSFTRGKGVEISPRPGSVDPARVTVFTDHDSCHEPLALVNQHE